MPSRRHNLQAGPVYLPINSPRALHSSPFRRPTSIVRHRCHIFDQRDVQSGGLNGANSGFTARARALNKNFHFVHAMSDSLTRGFLSHQRCRVSRAPAGTFEPASARGTPRDDRTLHVCDCHGRVVKRRLNMNHAHRDILDAFRLGTLDGLSSLGTSFRGSAYRRYQQTTSAFVPWIKRRSPSDVAR